MTTTIVFDVNETLLDLAAMDPIFEHHFGDASVRREWFAQVLMTTLTMTLVGDYANFAKVGEAACDGERASRHVHQRRSADRNHTRNAQIATACRCTGWTAQPSRGRLPAGHSDQFNASDGR